MPRWRGDVASPQHHHIDHNAASCSPSLSPRGATVCPSDIPVVPAPANELRGQPEKVTRRPSKKRSYSSDGDSDVYEPPVKSRSTGTGRRDARAAVAEEESEEEGAEEEDEVDLAIRAPRGTATKERRRQQNRIAQRALRTRKDRHLRELKSSFAKQTAELKALEAENVSLRKATDDALSQLEALRARQATAPSTGPSISRSQSARPSTAPSPSSERPPWELDLDTYSSPSSSLYNGHPIFASGQNGFATSAAQAEMLLPNACPTFDWSPGCIEPTRFFA